jgi:hypothetical protein
MAQLQAIVSCCNQSQEMLKSQAFVSAPQPKKVTHKATPSAQQVWVPKGSELTKHQSQAQPSKTINQSAPPESVFSCLGKKSIFNRLSLRIPLDNLKITAADQTKKKRKTAHYEEHFSVNTISISYDTDPDTNTEMNMVQDD